jgi:hypothetical protein
MAAPVRTVGNESRWYQSASLFVRSDEGPGQRKEVVDIRSDKLSPNMKTTVLSPNKRHFIAFLIATVPEVESVFTQAQDDFLHVYTVVDAFDASVRKKIYEMELQIIDNFEMCDFDFQIVSRVGKPLSDLFNDPDLELSFQRSE